MWIFHLFCQKTKRKTKKQKLFGYFEKIKENLWKNKNIFSSIRFPNNVACSTCFGKLWFSYYLYGEKAHSKNKKKVKINKFWFTQKESEENKKVQIIFHNKRKIFQCHFQLVNNVIKLKINGMEIFIPFFILYFILSMEYLNWIGFLFLFLIFIEI